MRSNPKLPPYRRGQASPDLRPQTRVGQALFLADRAVFKEVFRARRECDRRWLRWLQPA
jgi:hypothetical protein